MTFYNPIELFFVSSLDGGKDLNGDGIDDLLLGSTYASDYRGAVWMIPGPLDLPGEPSAAPTMAPSAFPTASPTGVPAITSWYLGYESESCIQTCERVYATCVSERLHGIHTEQKFMDIVAVSIRVGTAMRNLFADTELAWKILTPTLKLIPK